MKQSVFNKTNIAISTLTTIIILVLLIVCMFITNLYISKMFVMINLHQIYTLLSFGVCYFFVSLLDESLDV